MDRRHQAEFKIMTIVVVLLIAIWLVSLDNESIYKNVVSGYVTAVDCDIGDTDGSQYHQGRVGAVIQDPRSDSWCDGR